MCLQPTLHGSYTASSVLSSPLSVYSRAESWQSSQASRMLRHYCFRECFVRLCARLCRSKEGMTSRLDCSQDQTVNHRASALSPQTHLARPGEDTSGLTPIPSLGIHSLTMWLTDWLDKQSNSLLLRGVRSGAFPGLPPSVCQASGWGLNSN